MGVAVRHLEVFDDLAFVPDVIAGGHHVDAEIEKFFRQRRRDSKPSRGIFAVGDDQIDGVLLAQFRQSIFYDRPPRTAKNVTDKKNFQDQVSDVVLATLNRSPTRSAKTAHGVPWQTGYWLLISAVFRKS